MKFAVLGQPQGKQRVKVTMRGGFATAYTPDKTVSYENLICLSFKAESAGAKTPFWDKPISMSIKAYYRIPKAFSKKKHNEALRGALRPQTKPDIDNVVKVVCDALNSIAYHDDTQIVEIKASKFYDDTPRLEIEIEEYNG